MIGNKEIGEMRDCLTRLQKDVPDFIDEHWPKGSQDRGIAMMVVALYLAENKKKWS